MASYVLSYGCFGGATTICYALRPNATCYAKCYGDTLRHATLRATSYRFTANAATREPALLMLLMALC